METWATTGRVVKEVILEISRFRAVDADFAIFLSYMKGMISDSRSERERHRIQRDPEDSRLL